ncbi:MAG: hypothetical protein ACREBV_02195, partial [Candidatus Zixiibacteriota bacterium]
MLKKTLTISTILIFIFAATQVYAYSLFGFPQVYSGADAMSDITAVDLDGDNFNDIVTVPFGANYIFVHINDGTGQ